MLEEIIIVMLDKGMETFERAYLVGVETKEDKDFQQSMNELKGLAEACNYQTIGIMIQKLPAENKNFCIGVGKVLELNEIIESEEVKTVIFDNNLSPAQLSNLQNELGAVVLDRTGLILDIFSLRAKTKAAKLQVETAKLKYMLPRLTGMRTNLSRQGGGSGSLSNKGLGEKKLELDRRRIEHRLTMLQRQLLEVSKEQKVQRKLRTKSDIPKVSLVGYTNAGKSTIFNRIVSMYLKDEEKKVFEKDMLFATLDTSVRKIISKDHKDFLLSDTVGFIHKLPYDLVEAFKTTLEEILMADLILYVIDYSDPNYKQHMLVTQNTLQQLGAEKIPTFYVYNKMDLKSDLITKPIENDNNIYISAKNLTDVERLADKMKKILYKGYIIESFIFPYDKGSSMSLFMKKCEVIEQKYMEIGVYLVVNCDEKEALRYKDYRVGGEYDE